MGKVKFCFNVAELLWKAGAYNGLLGKCIEGLRHYFVKSL